jgi:hypothetical protein
MACPLTQNYTPQDCLTTAGVKSYYLTPFSNFLTSTVTANVVTAITKTLPWKQYKQVIETATWSHTGDSKVENGTYAYDWEAIIVTVGLNTVEQAEFELLMQNKLILIAEMQNSDFWILGRHSGSNAMNDKFDSGKAMGDKMGNVITLKGRSNTKMLKVDPTIIAGLLV